MASVHVETVSLQEIGRDTVRTIVALDVRPEQRSHVASNAVSIAEAHFNPGAWFRAIYADLTPVGFIMLFDPAMPGAVAREPIAGDEVGLWRLMVDQRYQRRGFGRRALDLVCSRVRTDCRARRLLASYVPGAEGTEAFYLAYGFTKTGRMRSAGTEIEIALSL